MRTSPDSAAWWRRAAINTPSDSTSGGPTCAPSVGSQRPTGRCRRSSMRWSGTSSDRCSSSLEYSSDPVKRIVVGYDGSEGAQRALDRAADLAQAFGSELMFASVITPVDLVPVGETVTMPLAPLAAPAIDPELEAERWQEIADEARRRLGERGLTAEIVS